VSSQTEPNVAIMVKDDNYRLTLIQPVSSNETMKNLILDAPEKKDELLLMQRSCLQMKKNLLQIKARRFVSTGDTGDKTTTVATF